MTIQSCDYKSILKEALTAFVWNEISDAENATESVDEQFGRTLATAQYGLEGPTTLVGVFHLVPKPSTSEITSGTPTSTGYQVEDLHSRTDPPVSIELGLHDSDRGVSRGLGQHKRHRHPIALNEERLKLLPRRRGEWSEFESAKLVQLADELASSIPKKAELYAALAAKFAGRSAEAVKKRLIKMQWYGISKYRAKVEQRPELLPKTPGCESTTDDEGVADGRFVENVDYVNWRRSMLECIADGVRLAKKQPDSGELNVDQTRVRLTSVVEQMFPVVWTPHRGVMRKGIPKSKKAQRKVTYARLQSLYKRKKKEAAKCVLDGQWKELWKCVEAKPEGMMDYWKGVLGAEAHLDARPAPTTAQEWSILSPITSAEVTGALRESVGSSPGMDKKDARELLTWNPSVLAQLLNLCLVTELPPKTLSRARISLIPKTVSPASPGDYRPIAISSVVLRLLHKLLFRRWRKVVKLEGIQFAFQERDGCLEASSLLNAILHSVHETVRPIAVAFLDISKAFDRVSHDTILRVAQAHGAPMPLVHYLRRLYSDGIVNLNGEDIRSKRGVRQGDPLSPLLFMMVMEEVVKQCRPELGYDLEGTRVGALAYADDLVLLAPSRLELEEKLDRLASALTAAGMELNGAKSAVMIVERSGKHKTLAIVPGSLQVGSEVVKCLGPTDTVKYLGLRFNWKGRLKTNARMIFQEMLANISKAPLKPYQRWCKPPETSLHTRKISQGLWFGLVPDLLHMFRIDLSCDLLYPIVLYLCVFRVSIGKKAESTVDIPKC
ncbi:hypothetical protein T265_01497 [Opisthorchis viverrini]|uniref:Reverse transcriptase domain-containing protein n=1 Tax=Opisthorchis viverrini TaxID=6198 RepID=A0A075A9L3_OPIVI|nr:hypothetical protein T265_01497 [Opisthorchis viverrini]KER32445.1 hypothetical protein T265_01497 [Opisthorchis viverrini]